ncbi:MAG: V-type ATP synthase subunit D [Thermoplasmata archaeon]
MAIENIKPTRSELLEVKKKIKLSQSGYKLLKMKRDGLIMEFFRILNEAKNIRGQLVEKYRIAQQKIDIAAAVDSSLAVKSAALANSEKPEIMVQSKNAMGVVVPMIISTKVSKDISERGYGVHGTTVRIDESARAYEELVALIIRAAEIETTMRKILEEIEKTKRRVNALEYKIIPDLQAAASFISLRLEEMERENTFRLKRIKKKR